MNQGVPVPDIKISSASTDVCEDTDGNGELSWVHSPQSTDHETSSEPDQQSNDITLRIRTSNLIGILGKDTNFTPAKRARINMNLMDSLDRLADFTTEIE